MKKIIIALLMLCLLLSSCSTQVEPVITEDDISPSNSVDEIVQDSIAADNFSYFWLSEDLERAKTLSDEGKLNFPLDEEYVKQQQALDPIVTAQEAANIAGQVMVEQYGFTPSDIQPDDKAAPVYSTGQYPPMGLDLVESDSRLLWRISTKANALAYTTTANDFLNFGEIILDATTGTVVNIQFADLTQERLLEMSVTQPEASFVFKDENIWVNSSSSANGSWDTESDEFDKMVDMRKQEITAALSGTAIANGKTVSNVELVEVNVEPEMYNFLYFRVEFEDGSVANLSMNSARSVFSSYDYGGYSLWNCHIVFGAENNNLL